MKARNYLARLRGPGKDMDSRLPPVIEVSSEEEAAETEIIWRTYASIVPALDYLAARGIIEPKPEGAKPDPGWDFNPRTAHHQALEVLRRVKINKLPRNLKLAADAATTRGEP